MGEDKIISVQLKDQIVKKHHNFLDRLDALIMESAIFSNEEKYNIMSDFQNRIQSQIDAEIYIEEKKLNK